eukprot:TRINITY_DN701_c0_g1_i1.p1 TRINITY_DN701_c0_g1~~TRINITY_DN701_c0_g1_i1.p1  ORF type:complete len:685 (-),score=137.19 TRINITY_DN701_c0_g1_i1:40-1797(-)
MTNNNAIVPPSSPMEGYQPASPMEGYQPASPMDSYTPASPMESYTPNGMEYNNMVPQSTILNMQMKRENNMNYESYDTGAIYNPNPRQPLMSRQPVPEFESSEHSPDLLRKTLDNIQTNLTKSSRLLLELKSIINNANLPVSQKDLEYFDNIRGEIREVLKQHNHLLFTMITGNILKPTILFEVQNLRQAIKSQKCQLKLYESEIESFKTGHSYYEFCGADLIIISQPFPQPIKKHQKRDVIGIKVQLIQGARTCVVDVLTHVKAVLVNDEGIAVQKAKDLQNNDKALNGDIAVFDNIEWMVGSHNKPVSLKFQIDVNIQFPNGNIERKTIQSAPTNQTIVYTNTRQWSSAQLTLLVKYLFDQNTNVTFEHFCNYIQILFLQFIYDRNTNYAKIDEPDWRPLLRDDFLFLKNVATRRGSNCISQTEFTTFWDWFGLVVKELRSVAYLKELWKKGLIWGLIEREPAEELLKSYHEGCFILRFSRNKAGELAATYKLGPGDDGIRHFLIDIKDKHKSILDYLNQNQEVLLNFVRKPDKEGAEPDTVDATEVLESMMRDYNPRRPRVIDNNRNRYDPEMRPGLNISTK